VGMLDVREALTRWHRTRWRSCQGDVQLFRTARKRRDAMRRRERR
jgi:hypothetical protein